MNIFNDPTTPIRETAVEMERVDGKNISPDILIDGKYLEFTFSFNHLLENAEHTCTSFIVEIESYRVDTLPHPIIKNDEGKWFMQLKQGEIAYLPTGVKCKVGLHYELGIRPFPNLHKKGLRLLDSPITVVGNEMEEILLPVQAINKDVIIFENEKIGLGILSSYLTLKPLKE